LSQVNLLLAHSMYRIIKYDISIKSFNKLKFLDFLASLVKIIKNDFDLKNYYTNNKICIVLDNVRFHKTKEIQNFLIENKIFALFNLAYQP